jgi:antitoxin component YwqK of YwqJK toxin-antitoxin module
MKMSKVLFAMFFLFSCKNKEEEIKINYFPNGNIESVYHYKNGKKSGPSQHFYENGVIKIMGTLVDGKPEGNAYWFYENGTLKLFRYYRNGKREGYVSDFYNDSFNTIKSILFFRNDSITYRKDFDQRGNFISEWGIHPSF